jgi:putative ABC transport system permease protein
MSAAAAEWEARRRLGNTMLQKERMRDVDVLAWLDALRADVRYALRALGANPGFALVAIASLALGSGATTAIFTLIDAVMLRALPVRDPEELVVVTLGEHARIFTNPLWEGSMGS